MCGRTSLFAPRDWLETRFGAELVADGGYTPRYNVAPGDGLEVVAGDAPGEIDRYRWGFLPDWADGPGDALINARSEAAADRPAFREAWERRPCLVLSSGFYEWQETPGGKRPYRIYREGDPAFAMAGLWEPAAGGRRVTVLTTEANDLVAPVHDRMPVVLPPGAEDRWLAAGPDGRASLCRPYRDGDLAADELSTRVNDPANDDPGVVEPVGSEQTDLGEFDAT